MSAIQIVVNILAAVGLLVIIGYLGYLLYKYVKDRQGQVAVQSVNPPGDYMQNTGIKCPDYWVNTGINSSNNNYVCKNSFNVQTNSSDGCDPDQMEFSPIKSGKTWEYGNPNGLTSYDDPERYQFVNKSGGSGMSRCDWINKCGPTPDVQGTWTGIDAVCNRGEPIVLK
jgi:hypothetical protein